MRYERPKTIEDAIGLLGSTEGKAHILAGGTDLLVRMKSDAFEGELVVDIKAIPGMDEITESATGFRIGAAVPCAALAEHGSLARAWPGLVEAANLIGSTQIQGRCTMSGNLCNASPAADSVPGLVAAGAMVQIAGPDGTRSLPVEEVPQGPGKTALAPGEILQFIDLPHPGARSGDAYLRFIPRTEMDIAVVGAAVSLTLDEAGKVSQARVALGAVGPKVIVVEAAAKALIGTAGEEEALTALASAASAACTPIDDKRGTIDFRKKVAGVLARRAAESAMERAGGQE